MAKLPQATGGTGLQIKDLAPDGQHIAVCLRVNDQFQVERPTFENKAIKEVTDVTRFVFGLVGPDGKPHIIQTYEFTISGAPGANLMKFLKMWLGRDAAVGWDYCEQLGKGAMITVQRKASKTKAGQFYANISGIAPVHPQLATHVPNPASFEPMLRELEQQSMQPTNTPPPTPPGPTAAYPAATPPPPPATRRVFVHVNGQSTPMDPVALARLASTGQGSLPAIAEGETAWRTVADYAPAAPPTTPGLPPPPTFPPIGAPGAAAPVGAPPDENDPF